MFYAVARELVALSVVVVLLRRVATGCPVLETLGILGYVLEKKGNGETEFEEGWEA
jgi:hypothetical protein